MWPKLAMRRGAALTALYAGLFLACDFALTQMFWYRFYPELEYRIADPLFHHSFKPNVATDRAEWGDRRYSARTNSLGFKDAAVRQVEKAPQRRRIVFIGDSFTEAMGVSFEHSFVGRAAQALPQVEMLNAAVGSYSPSIYWRKLAWLLDEGYRFDEAIVYIDVSDLQDEAIIYREDGGGTIRDVVPGRRGLPRLDATMEHPLPEPEPRFVNRATRMWLKDHFYFTNLVANLVRLGGAAPGSHSRRPEAPRRLLLSYWTVDPSLPGYGAGGVEGGIAKSIAYMDRLKGLLDKHGIALSVGVYPWPDQLDYDTVDSSHVKLWRGWCARQGCRRFIDHFPDFFRYKSEHEDWRQTLFIPGDVHYSERGNALVAERLIASLR
jgi:hypothetical protein